LHVAVAEEIGDEQFEFAYSWSGTMWERTNYWKRTGMKWRKTQG